MDGMPLPGNALPAIGDEIAGKYRIESIVGQGGMGAVFAARNVLTGKRVAIKWLLPEHAASTSRDRLLREAQIAASIDHPNVVDIYDVGEHQGGLFLVMEYLRGRALSDVLAERGRLDPEELIALLVPAMKGVHAAHQAGVVHRDLKPENIILTQFDGHVVPKVVDFGVSKTVGTSGIPHSSLTRTGALVGTPHFMALEQVDGTNQIDGRTDVYAFGVLLYRSLTGHFPFDGSSLGEVILKIGTKDPVPMRMLRSDLPAELDTVVLRALSRDRTKRFGDLEELARALLPFAPGVRLRDTADTTGRFAFSLPPEPAIIPSYSGPMPKPPAALSADVGPSSARSSASMLGAAVSLQGGAARVTPVASVPTRKSPKVWGLVAAALVALLIGGFLMIGREAAPVAEVPAPSVPSVEVKAAAAAPVPSVPSPPSAPSTRVENTAQLAPEPAHEAAPIEVTDVQKTSTDGAPTAIIAPQLGDEPVATDRVKRARPVPTAKPRPVKLIPGDRTKGLSVDEF